tara:strand:+ start:654 stop:803 length:150 start_codon:yes stop_codon:yes gene_type:complete
MSVDHALIWVLYMAVGYLYGWHIAERQEVKRQIRASEDHLDDLVRRKRR